MSAAVPPLAFFCISILARFPDQLHHIHHRRVPASPALLDAFAHTARDPSLWAALVQLVHPLPPHLHDYDLSFSHPALPLLQKIPDSPDFSLVTLLSLPNCARLRDDDIADLRSLHRLLALDLRGCPISSYALTTLARGLALSPTDDSIRSGTWSLRLLGLHGCPNIDNDVLSVLHKFPLLSVVVPLDLRFTRCTPTVVNTRLSPLGFHPSDNKSLFYPAPLSLALCGLEKAALTVSNSASLYSCPPQSVFRIHINDFNHPLSHARKTITVADPSTSHSTIRIIPSAEDTVVFFPPLRKQAKRESLPRFESSESSTAVPVVLPSLPADQPTNRSPVSNVSSFYGNAPAHSKQDILPFSSRAVQSSDGGRSDLLAIARSPPSWKALDTCKALVSPNRPTIVTRQSASDNTESLQQSQPIACRTGQASNNSLRVDRARLRKRGSDAVADIVRQFASKRPKVGSEFAPAKTRARVSVKSCNPFARSARSVFTESSTDGSDKPRPLVRELSKEAEPNVQQRTDTRGTLNNKRLKPITSLKPPVLPKELLPPSPQHAPKHRTDLRQTRLAFAREIK